MAQHLRKAFLWSAVVLATAGLNAQNRPDFSGTWVALPPDQGEVVVKQTATTLEASHDSEGGHGHRFVYKLDGSESRNEIMSHGVAIVTTSRAAWKGAQLTITSSTTYPDGKKSDQVLTWSLDAKGQLVVEGTETMSDGGTGKLRVVSRKKTSSVGHGAENR